jgi:hypothetical protein
MRNIEDKESEEKRPKVEQAAAVLMNQLEKYINRGSGQFLRDEDGSLHITMNGQRIPINFDPNNELLADLMLGACKVSTFTMGAKSAIQRLQVFAGHRAGKMSFRKFSALSLDENRLYVPIDGVKLLLITSDEIKTVANGEKQDSFWVEHPYNDSLNYVSKSPEAALELFENLLVQTQSCAIPEMKWLVAMNEGLFPYIRDGFTQRFLTVHQGGTQQGKTSGAQRFTLLHGLGQVMGDFSVASLGNVGDIGLLVLDNREQANFKQDLIDFCLFLATGGQRGRSFTDGRLRVSRYRPVGVITTIEGVYKAELEARCVTVEYAVSGGKIRRGPIESEILQKRHEILSSLMVVLQRYLQIRGGYQWPNPIDNFEEHFTALCDLLRAFGEVAGKPEGWAREIISKWDEVISNRGEAEEDQLEQPLLRIFHDFEGRLELCGGVYFEGKRGRLYVTTSAELLSLFQALRLFDRDFPKTANGLSNRLNSARFRGFRFLKTDSMDELKRKGNKRPIGFFFENED